MKYRVVPGNYVAGWEELMALSSASSHYLWLIVKAISHKKKKKEFETAFSLLSTDHCYTINTLSIIQTAWTASYAILARVSGVTIT